MKKRKYRMGMLVLLLSMSCLLVGCKAGESSLAEDEIVAEISTEENESVDNEAEQEVDMIQTDITLREAVENKLGGFIGTGVTLNEMKDEKLWDIITTQFNAITFGNELKPDSLFGYSNGKCPGTTQEELNGELITVPVMDYSRPEEMLEMILTWNEEHADAPIKVRGHVLVWHSQTPEWFFHENYDKSQPYVDKDTMNKRLEWYIKTVLTHFTGEDSPYKDMFYGWDVVNEAVSDATGTYRSDQENAEESLEADTHGSNSSWWHVYESNEYIIKAFQYANQYAPASVELYYNDYNECDGKKLGGIIELLKAVKEAQGAPGVGTRIDAMGMQGHYNMSSPSMDKFDAAVRAYAKVVDGIQITEMDLKASDDYDGSEQAKETEYAKQASRYAILYRVLWNANREEDIHISGITFWGVCDHYSWLQSRSNVGGGSSSVLPQCPLLFDENYEPKPAFYVFTDTQ